MSTCNTEQYFWKLVHVFVGQMTTTGRVLNITTQGGKVIASTRASTANVVTVNPKTLQLTAIKGAAGTTGLYQLPILTTNSYCRCKHSTYLNCMGCWFSPLKMEVSLFNFISVILLQYFAVHYYGATFISVFKACTFLKYL